MSLVSPQGFTALVDQQIAALQANATLPVDASQGSITRAQAQSVAGVAMWLQAAIYQLLLFERAATSAGPDLDSWMADWNFTRLPALQARTPVTFSRFVASGQVLIPIGSTVATSPGGTQFTVVADTTNLTYSTGLGAYVVADGTPSVAVATQAVNAGSAGNVLAGTLIYITSPIPGIDTATNVAPATGGFNAELDPAFLARFQLYIQSLREATVDTLKFYVVSLQQGVTCRVVENFQPSGVVDAGFVYLVVDDGSGNPPASLLAAASALVDHHRAAGISYGVIAPTIVYLAVFMVIVTAPGADHASAVATVANALSNYLNTLPVGTGLSITRLYQIAYDASQAVFDVTSLLVDGSTSDIAVAGNQVLKSASIAVN